MKKNGKNAVIIVAAGLGLRAGGDQPKQWQKILGKTLTDWTLSKFITHPRIHTIILVVDDKKQVSHLRDNVVLELGGSDRSTSVRNGLSAVPKDITKVLIHDVARPCVSHELINSIINGLDEHDAVIPILNLSDALWEVKDNLLLKPCNREDFVLAQTPQGFDMEKISKAYALNTNTQYDDAAVAVNAGLSVVFIEGDRTNIKLTFPSDFNLARNLLGG
jgi:2-C-methyl-D-erythritol 4-phosphate cytidylyltransferase